MNLSALLTVSTDEKRVSKPKSGNRQNIQNEFKKNKDVQLVDESSRKSDVGANKSSKGKKSDNKDKERKYQEWIKDIKRLEA